MIKLTPSLRFLVLALGCGLLCACGGAESRLAKHMEKGRDFLAKENLEKARIEFQNALQISPTNAEARFENGVVDERLGKPREAAAFYQGAIDVNSDHLGARTNLARLYLFSAQPDRAIELIAPALIKHPDDPELLAVRAAVKQQQKDPAGALADAERAAQLAPTNEDVIAVLAGLYTASHENAKAQALLERTIEKIPGTIDLRLALAQIYAQENRVAESEALLLKLVQLRPNDKAHRLRLAQYYARLKQTDAAEQTLRNAVKALPDDFELKIALIDFLTVDRSRDAAAQELEHMIAAAPKDEQLKFALARFYESEQRATDAEKVYQGVIAEHEFDASGLMARDRLAQLRLERADVPGAMQLIGQVLAKSPRDNDALALRGEIELRQQDPRAAIADLRAVLRDQPNAVAILRILAHAHLANGEPAVAEETLRHALEVAPGDAALRLDFAQVLIGINKPEQAKPLLAELIKQQPGNSAALHTQFRLSAAAQDWGTALSDANAITALQPKAAVGYYYQGLVAEAQKRNDDALRLYNEAVDAEPNSLEPLQAEVRLLVSLRRTDQAFRLADDITSRYPASPLGPEAKGELKLSARSYADAQRAFETAAARSPNWWPPYHGLAAIKIAQNDFDGAIAVLNKAKATVKQSERLGIELASAYDHSGKSDLAIAEYEAVLAHNPQSDVAANNLAMLLATQRTDPASLDRAKVLSARFSESVNPSFMDTYGWVLYKRGEAAASVPVLERVAAQEPNEPVVLYHLGMAQSLLGSPAQARENLSRAVQSGAKFSGLEEAKATLEKIAKLPQTASAGPKS